MARPRRAQRVVVVTGGTAGVGRSIAREFARIGDRVAVLAKGHKGLEQTVKELGELGCLAYGRATDVTDPNAVRTAATEIEKSLGPIDVWINTAAVSVSSPFWALDAEEFKRITEVDYLGFVNGTRAALETMRPRNRGVIIQVGRPPEQASASLDSAWNGARFAVVGLSEAVQTELSRERSRVTITTVLLPTPARRPRTTPRSAPIVASVAALRIADRTERRTRTSRWKRTGRWRRPNEARTMKRLRTRPLLGPGATGPGSDAPDRIGSDERRTAPLLNARRVALLGGALSAPVGYLLARAPKLTMRHLRFRIGRRRRRGPRGGLLRLRIRRG